MDTLYIYCTLQCQTNQLINKNWAKIGLLKTETVKAKFGRTSQRQVQWKSSKQVYFSKKMFWFKKKRYCKWLCIMHIDV